MIGEVVVNEERSHEQTAQQQILIDLVAPKRRVAVDIDEVGVGAGVVGAMRADIAEPASSRLSVDDKLVRHGVEAEEPPAEGYFRVGRFDHRAESHGRESSPRGFSGEEPPVVEHVASHCVGDVVGGECEPFDGEANLAFC